MFGRKKSADDSRSIDEDDTAGVPTEGPTTSAMSTRTVRALPKDAWTWGR